MDCHLSRDQDLPFNVPFLKDVVGRDHNFHFSLFSKIQTSHPAIGHSSQQLAFTMRITCTSVAAAASSALLFAPSSDAFAPVARHAHSIQRSHYQPKSIPTKLFSTPMSQPTELPDSLSDAASIAANACHQIHLNGGPLIRCRVDFDTSVGDETYTSLKSSTEFMQQFVTSLSLAAIPGVMDRKQKDVMRMVEAKAELKELRQKIESRDGQSDEEINEEEEAEMVKAVEREEELLEIIANQGSDSSPWEGPKVRIYFPDAGSAALAKRDWKNEVPPCVQFSSCGGILSDDISSDSIIIFFCPRASEAESVEKILYNAEERRGDDLMMTVMVNPLLVDMGVTGFGMAGRRLRERLIDNLIPAYYLRTLPWGALTRVWPQLFTVWQEDENAEGGYRMIKAMDRLPSNPEVEDIFDIENGDMNEPGNGPGFLSGIADFVNGMTRL